MTQNFLLFSIGTTVWAASDREISSVVTGRQVHRLPLSPPSIAGMALLDERPVTVFDLGSLLGAPPLPEPQSGSFLLIDREGRSTAFVIAGKVDRVSAEDTNIVPLPALARSSVVHDGLLQGRRIVPLISMQELLDRVREGDLSVPGPEKPAAAAEASQVPSSVLVFTIGDERYCLDASVASVSADAGTEVTRLAYAPDIAGLAAEGGDIIPIVPFGIFRGDRKSDRATVLVVDLPGLRCGLPVDHENGRRDGVSMLPLPPIAATAWSSKAMVEEGEVVPLLDPASILDPSAVSLDGQDELASRYHPASPFLKRFLKEDVELVELQVFGARHALPKDEVRSVHSFLPIRRIVRVPEIVLGVAELEGRLLPVLDMEAVFGRRSPVAPDWRLVLVSNGDFEALVAVQTVHGDKALAREMQRQVPIAVPHQVLYGCYLDESAVRLILNVEALAVHFEKTEIRELISGMAPEAPVTQAMSTPVAEMKQPVVDEVRPEESTAGPAEQSPAEMHAGEGTDAFRHSGYSGTRSYRAAPQTEQAISEEQRKASEEEQRRIEEERQRAEQEARERAETEARAKAEEEERVKAEEEARARTEEEAHLKAAEEERIRSEQEKQRIEQEARERAEAEARAKAEDEARQKAEEEERLHREEAERQRIELETRERREQEERERAEQEAREREERARAEEEVRSREAEEVRKRTEADAETRRKAEERLRQVIDEELRSRQPTRTGGGPVRDSRSSEEKRNRTLMAAIIAALFLLMVLLYFLAGRSPEPKTSGVVPPAPTPAPAVQPPALKSEVKKEPEPPLYIKVPAAMPKPETIVYVVVKGDTLWGIAKRFTGNPFNYPRVARDNSIATPDLIFPGQRIKLIQEKR